MWSRAAATGEQAAHVVEALCAINAAYAQGQPVQVTSTFTQTLQWIGRDESSLILLT